MRKRREARHSVLSRALYPGTRPGSGESGDAAEGERLRQLGNGCYSAGDVEGALALYSECVARDPSNHIAYANRSACWLRLERAEEAIDDAERCVLLSPRFAKGYLRKGAAEWKLGRVADARASYEAGMAMVDPSDDRLEREHRRLAQRSDTSARGAARAAMYRTLRVSPSLDVDGLFELLQEPERITRETVERQASQLDALLEYLARTLECDVVVLAASTPLREAYDRATFACGQLLSAAPGAASRLRNARRVVDALRHSLRCGWQMEPRARSHGVSKFAANALAIVACSHDAADDIRRLATRHLLHGMLAWLVDATPEPDLDGHDDHASRGGGQAFSERGSRRTSAEVVEEEEEEEEEESDESDSLLLASDEADLAQHPRNNSNNLAPDVERRRLDQQRQRVVCGCGALCPRLSAPTWLERLFERGAPSWVRDECEKFVDAELLSIQLCVTVRDERAPPLGLPGLVRCVARRIMKSELRVDLFVRPEWRWDAAARVADDADAPAAAAPAVVSSESSSGEAFEARPGETDAALARRLQRAFDDDAVRRSRADPQLPARRLGEWLAASLGYLVLFIDGDELFAAHACAALERLATCAKDAADRVCRGVWAGVPLLEKLSALACKDAHAVALLEALARRSSGARAAMLSLADALAGESPPDASASGAQASAPSSKAADAAPRLPAAAAAWEPAEEDDDDDDDENAAAAAAAAEEADPVANDDPPRVDHEQLSDDGATAPTPSWSEYFHELRGTLGIGSGATEDDDEMVLLANFETAAQELPIAGELVLSRSRDDGSAEVLFKMSAVPAAWNERFADSVRSEKGLCGDPSTILGSDAWQASIDGGCVLVERSAIRKSPKAPDWASAVQLCADAGAQAAIVSNDLQDDGASRPAFRMGVFGAKPPPIAGFMVNGADGDALREIFPGRAPRGNVAAYKVEVRTIRNEKKTQTTSSSTAASESLLPSAPTWPLRGVPRDVAQAWALAEVVASAAPTPELRANLEALAARMEAAEKRVWLARRLQRHHRSRALLGGPDHHHHQSLGSDVDDDYDYGVDDEPPLAFVECDRDAPQLPQLRHMLRDQVGLGAADITGDFEVRFRGESAVGSAVVRDWMDLVAHEGFVSGGGLLLTTRDHGRSFLPNPAACFVNEHWISDFELLGRLVGLALWQQVTLDLPLHAYVCEALLYDGDVDALFGPTSAATTKRLDLDLKILADLDPDLARSLRWILDTDDRSVFETLALPLTDALDFAEYGEDDDDDDEEEEEEEEEFEEEFEEEGASSSSKEEKAKATSSARRGAQPVVVSRDRDAFPRKDEEQDEVLPGPGSSVELVAGGDDLTVTPETRLDFVTRMCDWRLRESIRGPLAAMARGLRAAVPPTVLADARKMLSAGDFVRLLSGLRDIDVHDWRRNTRFAGGLRPDATEVVWFWNVVEKWAAGPKHVKDRLHQCLQFATGSRRVPIGGFAHLVGLNGGKHPFTLSSGSHLAKGSLPTAHACICTIDLPRFDSFEAAESKLLAAVQAGTKRFDEHATREDAVP
ncbi:hypothetical protein CTAYLR_007459 [Chrysophaeum taylorii]|uniref:HECT-type E3 ubiquitin transferase n=1 Tax=Chrysophaeum taylorii TaxID=2483200 RepID=A0AAD7XHI0_9STRA|nr:hypothetical protein CTAYLR_007459 [Chrysophaeum taylorii]